MPTVSDIMRGLVSRSARLASERLQTFSLAASPDKYGLNKQGLTPVAQPPRIAPEIGIPASAPFWVSDKAMEIAASPEALYGSLAAGAGPTYDRYLTYAANQLDPNQIDTIFRQADRGQYLVQYGDLWQLICQRDYQMFALDRGRRVGITTKTFQINASDTTDDVSNGVRNAVEAMVDGIDAFDTDGVHSMLAANGPGYSLLEIIYEVGTIRFPWNGTVVSVQTINPRQLRFVLHKHLYFKWDDDEPYLQIASDGQLPLRQAPYKWIWYKTLGDGIASMRGFFRPCAWLHLLGQTSMVSGAIFLKLFGIPQLAAYINQEKYKDANIKAVVDSCMKSYGNGTPTVMPDWLQGKIEAKDGPIGSGSVELHMKWRAFIDTCMAKAIQGASLQIESSSGGPGSYAQSVTHENRSYDVAEIDSVGTCGALKAQLFKNWLKLNSEVLAPIFGIDPRDLASHTPHCSRRIDRETSPRERAEIAELFAVGGMELSKRQLRSEYAFDVPDSDEDAYRGSPVKIQKGGAAVPAALVNDEGGVKLKEELDPNKLNPNDVGVPPDEIELTPGDLANIVTVDEARNTRGLPPIGGTEGAMTVTEHQEKYSERVAAASAALSGHKDPKEKDDTLVKTRKTPKQKTEK